MDQTSKLYRLYAELSMLKHEIQEFEALHPNPRKWTPQQGLHYDSLINRLTNLRAGIAELGARRRHGQH